MQPIDTTNTHVKAIRIAKKAGKLIGLVFAGIATVYIVAAVSTRSFTPGLGNFRPPPDGYQSIQAFRNARTRNFAALYDDRGPGLVAGAGHLRRITNGKLYGTTPSSEAGHSPDVMTLHIERLFGPNIVAHLDVPVGPDVLEHLRSLRRGAVVSIAGIGHGDGESNVYIYPVHQIDGHTP